MQIHKIPGPLRVILPTFLVLALVYVWATPLFEASDELWHFGMVEHIAMTGRLPVQDPDITTSWEQEGSQPPLYYVLAAGISRAFDLSDLDSLREPNPHVKAGVPLDRDNKNLVLHATLHPPLRGSALAVYAVRLFSILLGLVTVSAVYETAAVLAPERPNVALLAAGLTAFNPMFIFITASVNNDNLVIALASVITWQMLEMVRDGLQTRRSILLAVLIALASLTKISGNVLVPVVVLAGLWVAMSNRDWRGLVVLGGLMLGVWLVIAGWWYWRNLQLYGELFGTQMMVAVAGPREESFTLAKLLDEFQGFRITYWGLFGGVNVLTANAFYVIMDLLTLAAAVGVGLYFWRGRKARRALIPAGLLLLLIVLGMAGVIQWTAQTYASQGRLLFPFIAAISSLMALGLTQFRLVVRPAVVLLGAWALVVPFASIAPAYARPAAVDALPDDANPVYAAYHTADSDGGAPVVTLVGYRAEDRRYEPGDYVPVTVYWQVNARSAQDLSLYLHAVDDSGNVLGKIDSFPGGGTLRTTTWEPGHIYADHYAVPLDEDGEGRSGLRIQVGWWHQPTEMVLEAYNESGAPIGSVMLSVGGFVNPQTAAELPTDFSRVDRVSFGGVIALEGYTLEDDVLTLVWEARGAPKAHYTVFVQVLNDEDAIAGQGDAPPTLPTGYWRSGEQYMTTHVIQYPEAPPAGEYRVSIGWYDPADFSRLGTSSPDNAYLLTTLNLP